MNLLPVQLAALKAAAGKDGFGYFMEMGLGKTLVALTEFQRLVEAHLATRLLVICPNSFKGGWAKEAAKHGIHLSVNIYDAAAHNRTMTWLKSGFTAPPMLIVNYDAMRLRKTQELIADYTVGRRVMLVCDESIALKNPQAKRTKAIQKLAERFTTIRILTGKPVTQGAHDMHQQLALIGATPMGYYPFRNTFCEMGGYEGKEVVGIKNEDRLRRLMKPYIFHATKKEWLPSLPEKTYTTREYTLNDTLAVHYEQMEHEFMTWVAEQDSDRAKPIMVEIALTKYGKLAQIHAGFIHDEGGVPMWLVEDKHNPRLQLLEEILDEIETKVCVCYRHRFVGEQLKRALTLRGMYPAVIEGNQTPQQIEEEKDFFNDDPRCRAILLQFDAAKYGHTILGTPDDPCHTMIFYENTYSLDTRTQIEDRIHRQGQHNACLYIDLTGTEMDFRIVAALQQKEFVYQTLFPSKGGRVASLERTGGPLAGLLRSARSA